MAVVTEFLNLPKSLVKRQEASGIENKTYRHHQWERGEIVSVTPWLQIWAGVGKPRLLKDLCGGHDFQRTCVAATTLQEELEESRRNPTPCNRHWVFRKSMILDWESQLNLQGKTCCKVKTAKIYSQQFLNAWYKTHHTVTVWEALHSVGTQEFIKVFASTIIHFCQFYPVKLGNTKTLKNVEVTVVSKWLKPSGCQGLSNWPLPNSL